MRCSPLVVLGLTFGLPAAAVALDQSMPIPIGDYVLQLVTLDDMSQQLLHGDRIILSDDRISPQEQMRLGDTYVRVLSVGSGGSVCSGSLQVLSEHRGKLAVSEKTDPCLYPEVFRDGVGLELRVPPKPARPGAGWRWSLANGLQEVPEEEFTPDPNLNWDYFKAVSESHPIDVLSFPPIYEQFKSALSEAELTSLAHTLDELGSGQEIPEGYAGEACAKWECDTRFGFLWVDLDQRQAYAFWRDDNQEFASPMPLKDWPQWVVIRAAEALDAK